MRHRELGKTGFSVSDIGCGLWGMSGWSGSDDGESLRALQLAVDLGCNFFDTAWAYGNGKSDGLLVDSEYVIAVAPDGAFWFRHRYDGLVERVVFDGDRVASVLEIKPDGVPTELTALHGFDSLGRYWQGTPHGLSMLADPVAYAAPRGNPAAPRAIPSARRAPA